MSDFLRETADVPEFLRMDHWVFTEPGEFDIGVTRVPDLSGLLVTTRGTGQIRMQIGDRSVEDTGTEVDVPEFARVLEGGLRAYAGIEDDGQEVRLSVQVPEGESVQVTVVQVAPQEEGFRSRLGRLIPCHICIRLVRSGITALLALMGVPDLGLAEEVLDLLPEDLPDPERLPYPLRRALEWLFGGDFGPFLEMLRRFIDNLPFKKIARAICELFGFC